MTRLERAKAICNRIVAMPDEIWTPIGMEGVDADVTVQDGWSAVITAKEHSAANAAENEEDLPLSFVLDVWVTGKGKVVSLDCGHEHRLISMRPGTWEQDLFGIAGGGEPRISHVRARANSSSAGTTSSGTQSARESRCRRLAQNSGLRLHKSRRHADCGLYMLIEVSTKIISYGSDGAGSCDATLEDIETYLTRH